MPLRRSPRLRGALALCLTLLLPGLGGAWLRYAHDCPVQRAAVAVGAVQASGGEHAHHSHGGGSGTSQHENCQCVGACDSGTARALPASEPQVLLGVETPARRGAIAANSGLLVPYSTPSDFLPLPNAPPIA